MGKQEIKNNGCRFFDYCMDALDKTPYNSACMDLKYYFDKLAKNNGCCEVLEARKIEYNKHLAAEAEKKASQPKQAERHPQETEEKQRTTNAAAIYIKIFSDFGVDPLTDKQIADRLFALTGVRPTNRNISSYRCCYNKGKIKGQDKVPDIKVERKRK